MTAVCLFWRLNSAVLWSHLSINAKAVPTRPPRRRTEHVIQNLFSYKGLRSHSCRGVSSAAVCGSGGFPRIGNAGFSGLSIVEMGESRPFPARGYADPGDGQDQIATSTLSRLKLCMSLRGVPICRDDEAISTVHRGEIAAVAFGSLAMTTPKISLDSVLVAISSWPSPGSA